MRRALTLAVTVAAIAALAVAGAVQAAPRAKALSGGVGPGFTIGVSKRTVTHGTFVITIRDRSGRHNFHLIGPGVNKRTSVSGTGTSAWRVTLRKGTYRFLCDRHPSTMHGTLRVR